MCSVSTRLPPVFQAQKQSLPVPSRASDTRSLACARWICNGASASGSMVKCSRRTLQSEPKRGRLVANAGPFPFDLAWSPNFGQSVAPQLFAASLLPYLVFLGFLTSSGKTPRITLIGFWFLLAFVGATIPAGIYAKTHYATSLANVDWLHGGAESLLTITNLLIVIGLRQGIREAEAKQQAASASEAAAPESGKSSEVPVSSAASRGSNVGDS